MASTAICNSFRFSIIYDHFYHVYHFWLLFEYTHCHSPVQRLHKSMFLMLFLVRILNTFIFYLFDSTTYLLPVRLVYSHYRSEPLA